MGLHGRHAYVSPIADNLTQEAAGRITPGRWNAAFTLDGFYDTRAAMLTREIPAEVKTCITGGYTTPGDGGLGLYKRMAAVPYDPTNPGFLRTVDRYTSAEVEDATNGGYWELVPDASGLRIEQFGGVADYWVVTRTAASTANPSPTDNRAALLEAIDYLYTHVDVAAAGDPKIATGATIRLGYGGYYFSDEITFDRTTCIQGMGTANYHDGAASRCYFAAGKKGFVFDHFSAGPYGTGASILRDVFIQSLGFGGQTTKHGIDINANVHIENVAVRGFGGNGIDISADITGGTNANCFYLARIFTYDNAGHGVYCTGGDSNAGVGVQINAMNNGEYGIRDDSFLGNTWLACHTAGNAAGAYYMVGVNSRSVMVGCYSESDQPASYLGPKAMVLGGLGAAGFTLADGGLLAGDGGFSGRVDFHNRADDTNDGILRLRGASNRLIEFNADGGGFAYALRYRSDIPAFALQYSEQENHALWLTTGATIAAGRSAPLEANCPIFPKGIWLGDSSLNASNFRNISYGSAAPVSGNWARGDRVYNLAPSDGGVEGWVCVTAGTPGTWKAFGVSGGGAIYPTVADVDAATIDASVKTLSTEGFGSVGVGRGIYMRMAVAPTEPTNPGYRRSQDRFTFAGATDATNGGYWKLLPQGGTLFADQFGVVADGVAGDPPTGTDNLAPALAAVRYAAALGIDGWAGALRFGVGRFRFSALFEPRGRVHLLGAGPVANSEFGGTTTFLFPRDTGGIQINHDQTFGTSRNPSGGLGSAEGSIVEKIFCWSPNNGIASSGGTTLGNLAKHAFRMRTKAIFRDIGAHGFPGDGVHIRASVGTADNDEWGNCNDWVVENPIMHVIGRHGVYVEGFDVNGGKCDKLVTHGIREEWGGCGIAAVNGIGCCQFSNSQITGYGNKGVYHLGGLYELIDHTPGIGAATEPGTNNRIWYRVGSAGGPVPVAFPQWSATGIPTANYIISRPVYNDGPNNLYTNTYVEGGGISHIDDGIAKDGNIGVTLYSNQNKTAGGGSYKAMVASAQGMGSFAEYTAGTPGYTKNGALAWVAVGTSVGGGANREDGINIFEWRRLKDGDTSWSFGPHPDFYGGIDLCFLLNGGNYYGRMGWVVTTPSTTFTGGTVRPKSGVLLLDGFALGDEWENEGQHRRFGISDSTPNRAYEHARGEVRFELNPVKGGHVGYSNIQTGVNNAQTWVSGTNYDRDLGGSFIVTGAGRYYEITVDPGASILSTVEPTHTTPGQQVIGADGYGWTYIGTTLTDWRKFGRIDWDASATYDPPSLATGAASPIQTLSMTGVQAGDFVQASFSNDLQGMILNAWCVGDAVKYLFFNPTGGTVDLGSGTVRVRVARQ